MSEIPPRLAIITGGTRGIGRGISESLASSGEYSALLLTYNTNREAAESFASELKKSDLRVEVVGGDITLPETRDAIFKCCDDTFVDCELAAVIHNAGQYLGITAENAEGLEKETFMFATGSLLSEENGESTNLNHMHYYQKMYGDAFIDMCERALKRMKKAKSQREDYRGSLIGISSPGCNFQQRPKNYDMPGSGKCVMEYAMRLYALRAAEFGINCNVVIPGVTVSDAWGAIAKRAGKTREEYMSAFAGRSVPMKKVIKA